MKNYLFLAATAVAVLASCSEESFVGDEQIVDQAKEQGAIRFDLTVPTATRADATGATAAEKLNNQFIVYGEKNENSEEAPETGNLVFQNYQVNYVTNSAYTTTSNTKDWEYVGFAHTSGYKSHISTSTTDAQTIKYWDYGASNYVFTAVSAKPADITAGNVTITKTTAGTTDKWDKGYTIAINNAASLSDLYFSNRVEINQSNNTDPSQKNTYGGNVTFIFRNAWSHVRVGMYETIPGYDVKVTKFYYANTAAPAFSAMTTGNETNFVANVPNMPSSAGASVPGTFTVKYYNSGTLLDQPTISFAPTDASSKKNFLTLGTGIINAAKLGETTTNATFDDAGKNYTKVFPQETNATGLKLKIDYELSNSVTGEKIKITGKTAEIPAQYLQWKANYKYTYLFKLTDDDLHPITFDAMVVDAGDGVQETITTVTEPSITTYAKASDVTTNNEYKKGSNIYVVVNNGTALTVGTNANAKLYTVTQTNTKNSGDTGYNANAAQGITEASVANVLAKATEATGVWELTDANNWKMTVTAVSGLTAVSEIAAADSPTNVAITINGAKFTPASAGTYVFEYIQAATYVPATGKYVAGTTYYTDNTGATTVDTTGFEAGVTDVSSYFVVVTPKLYKVIKVVD